MRRVVTGGEPRRKGNHRTKRRLATRVHHRNASGAGAGRDVGNRQDAHSTNRSCRPHNNDGIVRSGPSWYALSYREVPGCQHAGVRSRSISPRVPGQGSGLAEAMELRDSGMHTTNSVDYGVVNSGEITFELDDGATVSLKQGDCVVQWHTARVAQWQYDAVCYGIRTRGCSERRQIRLMTSAVKSSARVAYGTVAFLMRTAQITEQNLQGARQSSCSALESRRPVKSFLLVRQRSLVRPSSTQRS